MGFTESWSFDMLCVLHSGPYTAYTLCLGILGTWVVQEGPDSQAKTEYHFPPPTMMKCLPQIIAFWAR